MTDITFVWFFSAVLTAVLFLLWREIGIRDMPSQRSAHSDAIPTAAGICIGFTFLVFSYLSVTNILRLEMPLPYSLIGFMILLIIGFIDDWKELNYKIRLLGHVFSVGFVLMQQNLPMSSYFVWFLVGVGLINACNFLDGLNGLLASQWLLTVGFLLCGFASFNSIFWILWVATLMYLFFNFPKARIFIGDTGSTILGFSYFIIIFSLASSDHGFPSFLFYNDSFLFFSLCPMSLAWADVIFTMIKRLIEKRSIVNSFGDYGFHHKARFFKNHTIVTLFYLVFNLILVFLSVIIFFNSHRIIQVAVLYLSIQILHWMLIHKLAKYK